MEQSSTLFRSPCVPARSLQVFFSLLLTILGAALGAQTAPPGSQLQYLARGTGRTTGHIATLLVYNPSSVPLRTTIGDCFIPPGQDYQGYVVLKTYTVAVPAFGKTELQLEGYCTNMERPAVPDGESMTEVSDWIPWASGAPLPSPNGGLPGSGFSHQTSPADADPLALTYPGTQIPFPYRIDFNRYPAQATRLLLYAAYAAEQAFDELLGAGKIQPDRWNRSPRALRMDLVQQALWAYAARLQGRRYQQPDFSRQYTEEVEQQVNQEQANFAPETQKQVERQTQDLWSGISLVGASAKLISPKAEHPQDIFRETPINSDPGGLPTGPMELLPRLIEGIDPKRADADQQLVPVLLFLQSNPIATDQSMLQQTARAKWEQYLKHNLERIQPEQSNALPALLTLGGWLFSSSGITTPGKSLDDLFAAWSAKLNTHVQQQAQALNPDDPAYLEKWRRMKAWQETRWYKRYCSVAKPLKQLPPIIRLGKHGSSSFNPAAIPLSDGGWKHLFLSAATAKTKKIPWWIPASAVPVAGGIVYLLLRKKDVGPLPTPPVAFPDMLAMPCNGAAITFALHNDSGESITITSVNNVPGLTASIVGDGGIQVLSTGTGVFVLTYVITDRAGQTAVGSITVMVSDQIAPLITCPAALTLEGCGQAPSPDISGIPVVSDFCDPAPAVNFVDNPSGIPCATFFARIWTATDTGGNSATCSQLISTTDQTAPEFSFCPPEITVPFSQAFDPAVTGTATAEDNCAGAPVEISFTDELSNIGACDGFILRSWSAEDICQNLSSCNQTIRLVDNTAPVFEICPGPVSVSCSQLNDLAITGQAKASDDCTSGTVSLAFADDLSGYNGCSGTVVRTWTATDASGNSSTCEQKITVSDNTPPEFTLCPPAITVSLGEQNNIFLTGMATAQDQCTAAINSVFTDDLSGFSDCGGLILREWTATDDCDNAVICEQAISVIDPDPPVFTNCPEAVSVECGQQNMLDLTGQATAADDCSGPLAPSYSDDPAIFSGCSGTILRTWIAADPGGNTATCTQTIVVADKTAPVFTNCPGPVSVPCGQQNDLDQTGIATAEDACNGATPPIFTDDLSGFSGCQGMILRNWTSMDSCDNTANCLQTISVFDNTPPVFTNCPQGLFVTCGQENNFNITGQAEANDACSGSATVSFTDDLSQFSDCEGLILRNWLATDLCGNTAPCQQAITVVAVPCSFTPVFAASAAICGNCNGSASITVSPTGPYAYQWSNGQSGPNATNLCPQTYSVNIHDPINSCTEIFFVTIPEEPGLSLTVLEIVPPSSPTSNNGRITVQVQPFTAPLPLEVFVDGVSIGFSGNHTFEIIDFPAGIYEIQVIDASGCPSNVVTVELFPQGPDPVQPNISNWQVERNQGASGAQAIQFQSKVINALALPELPLESEIYWNSFIGIGLQFRLNEAWQVRWAANRQQGLQRIKAVGAPEPLWQIPVELNRQELGFRHFTLPNKGPVFFKEAGLAKVQLRSRFVLATNGQLVRPLRLSANAWQLYLGGGMQHVLWKKFVLEWNGRLLLSADGAGISVRPVVQIQLISNAGLGK